MHYRGLGVDCYSSIAESILPHSLDRLLEVTVISDGSSPVLCAARWRCAKTLHTVTAKFSESLCSHTLVSI